MIVAGATLAALLATCAPDVAPSTMAAIVAVETGGDPYALHDNATGRSYAPRNDGDALTIAQTLIREGHRVDVGLAQVNSANFTAFRTTPREMLDPCSNLRVASRILGGDYAAASSRFHEPRMALWHAISAYNTGSLSAGAVYVDRVVAAASAAPQVPQVPSIALLRRDPLPDAPTSRVAARIESRPVRAAARPRLDDFAVGAPNPKNLVTPSTSTRTRSDTGFRVRS